MILDDLDAMRGLDPQGMLERITEVPAQCRVAWEQAAALQMPAHYAQAERVLILGMGGSAQGGDLLANLAAGELRLPVLVNRQYTVPAIVDQRTLVIACSYSGNTEETLAAFQAALDRGCMGLAVASGGKLADLAAAHSVPFSRITYRSVPRAALTHSFMRLLVFFQKLGFIADKQADLAEAIDVMVRMQKEIGASVPAQSNPAKHLAQRLLGHMPVIYGSDLLATVAKRWKGQLNENAKSWAFADEMPELNHNSVMGTRLPPALLPHLRVVMLLSDDDHARNRLRFRATRELLERDGLAVETVVACGRSRLAQMFSLIHLGDFVSFYLAMLHGADPTDTSAIEWLKARMAEAQ